MDTRERLQFLERVAGATGRRVECGTATALKLLERTCAWGLLFTSRTNLVGLPSMRVAADLLRRSSEHLPRQAARTAAFLTWFVGGCLMIGGRAVLHAAADPLRDRSARARRLRPGR